MKARIRRHRRDRPTAWRTVESPVDLAAAVSAAPDDDFLLIDCLTLWVSNLMERGTSEDAILDAGRHVAGLLVARHAVVVTNEVGLGIVPENALARTFVDLAGRLNQEVAARAQRVIAADIGIDALQREIEDKAVLTIARRQPMAVDLRELVGALRLCNDRTGLQRGFRVQSGVAGSCSWRWLHTFG